MLDLTYTTEKTNKLTNISQYESLAKEHYQMLAKETTSNSDRPSNYNILTDYYNHLISYYAGNPTLLDAFFLCQYSDTMITIFDVLNKKIFKGGLQKVANKENPSEEEEKLIDQLISYANQNNDSLVEVLKEVETAANWSNLRTLLLLKEYKVRGKEIETTAIKEIMHIDPLTIEPMKDGRGRLGYDKNGYKLYFSLSDRNSLLYSESSEGKPNLTADYRVMTDNGYTYYNRSELFVKKKFPFNPIFGLKNKILSMISQDKFIQNEYSEGKPSKKMLLFKGKNLDEVKTSLSEYSKAVRENPNKLHPLMMGGVDQNMNMVEVVDLVKSMEEMQVTEFRNEFRNAMGAPYGVAPIYQNDQSTSGGLNNEGLQITVTNESIESNKDEYDQLLYYIFNITLGIKDWKVCTYPNEEQDEVHIEELLKRKLENAEKVAAMGGKVKFVPNNKDRDFDIIYEESELQPPANPSPLGEENIQKQENKEELEDIEKPFADYDDFDQCVNDNQDKVDPEAYCGEIMERAEKDIAKQKKNDKVSSNLINKVEKSIKNMTKDARKKLIESLDKSNLTQDEINNVATNSETYFDENEIQSSVEEVLSNIYKQQFDNVEKKIGINVPEDKNALQFLQQYTFQNIKSMTQEISNDLRQELQRGVMAGEGSQNLKNRVKKVFDSTDARAETIARTELNRANSMGEFQAWKASGLNAKKYIDIVDDDRTTKVSKAMQSKYGSREKAIPIDEQFSVNVEGKTYSGLTPPFMPNDRDTVIYILE